MLGLFIIFLFYGIGVILHNYLQIPLPANLLGLLLLFLFLSKEWVKLRWVEMAANFLLKHLMLFFVPIVVGVVTYLTIVQREFWPVIVSLVISPLMIMLVTGIVVQKRIRKQTRDRTERMGGEVKDA